MTKSGTRLNKFLAQSGVASRRAADELIVAGKVRVNGKLVRTLGSLVREEDRVEVNGAAITRPPRKTYLVLHKPAGVVTTMRDPQGRRTVVDLLPGGTPRIVPVGRLDYDSTGVLLLTDDGDLANRLLHPRFGVEKTYRAVIAGRLTPQEIRALHQGVAVPEFRAHACRVRVLAPGGDRSVIEVTLHEGKNRQVRRMLDALGHCVLELQRRRFGPIALGELRPGRTRSLTTRELEGLRRIGAASGRAMTAGRIGPKKVADRRLPGGLSGTRLVGTAAMRQHPRGNLKE